MDRILINRELCTGCKSCVLACMLKHSEAEKYVLLRFRKYRYRKYGTHRT